MNPRLTKILRPTHLHRKHTFFSIFPWDKIDKFSEGIEIGCGTGRFAQFVAPQVGHLTLVDAAPQAIDAARRTLAEFDNCTFINAPIGGVKLEEGSLDFGYSFGVLHHIPDTRKGMRDCIRLLKPGAPFLVYLYYRFDNRPFWYGAVWRASEIFRFTISSMPPKVRHLASDILAGLIYWPFARGAWLGEKLGLNVHHWPLSDYRSGTFRRMRNNSRDRFGTPLEQRFTCDEMRVMMEECGLTDIVFRDGTPYWCACGIKR